MLGAGVLCGYMDGLALVCFVSYLACNSYCHIIDQCPAASEESPLREKETVRSCDRSNCVPPLLNTMAVLASLTSRPNVFRMRREKSDQDSHMVIKSMSYKLMSDVDVNKHVRHFYQTGLS